MNVKKSLTLFGLILSGGVFNASAASNTWIGAASSSWVTTTNWVGGVVPGTTSTAGNGDTATFNSSPGVAITMATRGLNTINFDTNAGSFTFNSGGFFLQSGGGISLLSTMTSTGQTVTFNTPVTAIGSFGINNNSTGNVLNFAGNLTSSSATGRTWSLNGTNTGTNTISGIISNNGVTSTVAVTKQGAGYWALTGANTYTGGTTISAGTLVIGVGGTGSVAGTVLVQAGNLGGTGSVAGNVTIGNSTGGSDSFIAAGNNGIGTFTAGGSLSLLSDATFSFELNSTTGNVGADKLVAAGVTLNASSQFSFTDLGAGVIAANTQFVIIDNTSGSAISGAFANLVDGSTFTSGANQYQVSYSGGVGGNDLVLTVVPEPSTVALLGVGLAVALRFVRRARRQAGTGVVIS